jgi:hypothetical protein
VQRIGVVVSRNEAARICLPLFPELPTAGDRGARVLVITINAPSAHPQASRGLGALPTILHSDSVRVATRKFRAGQSNAEL